MLRSRWIARQLGVLATVALGLEMLARALAPAPLDWKERPADLVDYDRTRGWALRPSAEGFTVDRPVRVNSAGFRDREFREARQAGVRRVACIGDSYVFGWGVALEDSFPKQLERELSTLGPTEVLNFGVGGYNAQQVRLSLEGLAARFRPDLVIYGLYWDDLVPVRLEALTAERVAANLDAAGHHSWLHDTLRRSRALHAATRAAGSLQELFATPVNRCGLLHEAILTGEDDRRFADLWAFEREEIVAMRDAARAAGARFAVLAWPVKEEVEGKAPRCRFADNATTACESAAVPLISTLGSFRTVAASGRPAYLPYESHPTPEAYRRSSIDVARAVEDRGLLPDAVVAKRP